VPSDSFFMVSFIVYHKCAEYFGCLSRNSPLWHRGVRGDFCAGKPNPPISPFFKGGFQGKRAQRAVVIIIALVALGSMQTVSAGPASLRAAYPAPTASFLPLWTAHDAGFFKKHELAVEIIQVGSSTRGMAAMLAGQIDVLAGGGTGGIIAQLQGYTDLAIFGTNVHTWVFSIYSGSSISEVSQLRGKKMGVTRFGGTMDFAARHFLKQRG
jgi:ABC-type nitrate/sulfonate/bicarbonate transport system substrate-binding protein